MNTIQILQVQETILDQLKTSKIHGFPFFAYTGIRNFTMCGECELKLDLPKNPAGLSHMWIIYDDAADLYNRSFCKNRNNLDVKSQMDGMYWEQLAEIIAREMEVY